MKKLLLLLAVILLAGCQDRYTRLDIIDLPPAGKLYRDYNGNCKLVLSAGGGYTKHEITLEGTCKS